MSAQGMNGRSQSLYRKYRPTTFGEDELVGQEHVSRTLRNAVRHDRVAHAYLFCGPRGSGKTSSARLLAKAVNCEDPDPANRPCNECAACRAINEGRATDIIEIDAASNRGIEDIRDLREKVKFAPAQLRTKFYIVDEVHQLTREASNALLKTLEEPPPHAIFILATTDPEKVLDTISSRCQTFIFHRIPTERIVGHLRRVAAKEGIRADDDALTLIARAATGAMRDALGLLDQLSAFGSTDEGITAETVRQLLGAGDSAQVAALVDALAAGEVGEGLRVINAVVDGGADVRQFTAQLVGYLRALLHAAASAGRGERGPADAAIVPAHLDAFSLGEVAALVKRFSQVDHALRHSSYGHLPLELCLVDSILARRGDAPQAQPTPTAATRERVPGPAPAAPRPLPPPPARGFPAPRPTAVEEAAPAPPERVPTPLRPAVAMSAAPITPTSSPAPTVAGPDPDEGWAASLASDESAPATMPRPTAPPAAPVAAPVTPAATAAVAPAPTPAVPASAAPPPPAAPAAPVPAPPPAPAAPGLSIEEVRDHWGRIRQTVRAASRRIEALLVSADPLQLDGDTLTLVAAYDFHRDGLNRDDARKVIEEVVAQVLGHPYTIRCVNQEEARALGPIVQAAPVAAPPPVPPTPESAASAPSPPAPADDPPPWSDTPPVAVAPAPTAAPDAPPRPQAHHIRETPPAAAPVRAATVDERYVNALRNLFNAVEIKS